MDENDRTWYIAISTLVLALVGIVLDAAIEVFSLGAGFWTFLSAVLGFLGAKMAIKSKKDDE